MGPLFEDDSGKADIHLKISFFTVIVSTVVLLFVGVLSALIPASRAANLDPWKPCGTNDNDNFVEAPHRKCSTLSNCHPDPERSRGICNSRQAAAPFHLTPHLSRDTLSAYLEVLDCPSLLSIASNPRWRTPGTNSSGRFASPSGRALALVGFLAAEVHTASCNFNNSINFPVPHRQPRTEEFLAGSPFPHLDPARIAQFGALIAAVVVFAIVLFFVFLYLNSVFRFILFDSVIKKHCSIGDGWTRWHRTGRRYFVWQLVLIVAEVLSLCFLIGLPLAIAAALGWFRDPGEHIGRSALGVILLIGLFLVFVLVAAAVQLIAKDFLVPIMALEGLDFADAWSRLLGIIRPEPGKYIIYLLLKIVLAIAAAILFGILTLIPIFAVVVPAVIALFAGYKAGLGWNVTTVSLVIIGGLCPAFSSTLCRLSDQ